MLKSLKFYDLIMFRFSIKTLLPWILISFGVFNQTVGTVYIVWHAINPSSGHRIRV